MSSLGKRKMTGDTSSLKRRFKGPKQRETVKTMVAKALKQQSEKKFFDVVITGQTPSTGAQIDDLTTMAAGSDESTRVGNKVTFVSTGYHFTGALDGDEAVANSVRVIMLVDKQANAATPNALAILQTDAFDSYYNMDNVDRFEILDDRIFDLPANAGIQTALVPQPVNVNVYKKLKDCHTTWASNSAVVANTNAIVCLQIARNAGGTYRMQFRSRFTDL